MWFWKRPKPDSGDEPEELVPDSGLAQRGVGWSTALVVGIALTVLGIILALQNTETARLEFLGWDIEAPLVVLLVTAVLVGVVFDEIGGLLWRHHRRRQLADRRELAIRRQRSATEQRTEPSTEPGTEATKELGEADDPTAEGDRRTTGRSEQEQVSP